MRYIAAYLLAVLGGNASPKVEDLYSILSSVGVDAEAENTKQVVASLQGKNIEELIAEGSKKLALVAGAGGAPATVAAPAVGGATPAAVAKKEEPKEESDDDMGFGLFD